MIKLLYSIVGILIPFIGTSMGSSFVFFLRNAVNIKFKKILIGFSIGVMLAASVWSLIIPSVEMAEKQNMIAFLPASIGMVLGVLFLILVNFFADKIMNVNIVKSNMLLFSVTLHNVPEGMAVGVCFAGVIGHADINLVEAMLLSIGIAIQNIPEGAIISLPLKLDGVSKKKAFLYGVGSGIVEPIAAIITILLSNFIVPVLPYLLSFAAGAMIYVVVEELIPEMHEGKKSIFGIVGVTIGFVVMMVLDIMLS
ncbi:MAG: ZIP family metal transporter [Bacilli bacterium]|nr:ZIP family metal transporter [Bacilli bacterium]